MSMSQRNFSHCAVYSSNEIRFCISNVSNLVRIKYITNQVY